MNCPPLQTCAAIEGTAQCVADWPIVEVDEDESESNMDNSNPSDSMSADAGVNNGSSNGNGGSSGSTASEMGGTGTTGSAASDDDSGCSVHRGEPNGGIWFALFLMPALLFRRRRHPAK